MNRLGQNFKYAKELSLGSFFIEIAENKILFTFLKTSKGHQFEIIYSNPEIAYKSIPSKDIKGVLEFDIKKFGDYYSLSVKDFEKHIDEKSFFESLEDNNGNNPPIHHTSNKPRMLIDKEIANLSLIHSGYPNLGKVINRRLARQKTLDPLGNPGEIFGDVTAGTSVPFPLGIGTAKTFIVDGMWDRIIMMDRDIIGGENTVAYAYPQYPVYSLSYPTDIITGYKRNSDPNNPQVIDTIVNLYVSDFGNNRIVRLDYVMQYNWIQNEDLWKFTTSYIRDQSFRVLTNNCSRPYSIALHPGINGNPRDSADDVLWYSEGTYGNKKLVCVDAMTGVIKQSILNLKNININPSRISVYRSPDGLRNLLAFIDEATNSLVVLKLETNGQFNAIVDNNVRYFQNFGSIKLNSVLLTSYNNGLDGTTIWVGGDGGPGGCDNGSGARCGYISTLSVKYINNFPAFVEYLATIWSGSGSPTSFVNLQNIHANNGYIDIATMEKWTNDYGLRRYKPGIDTIGNTTLSIFCTETGRMTYSVALTNPARAFFTAEHKPAGGQWTSFTLDV